MESLISLLVMLDKNDQDNDFVHPLDEETRIKLMENLMDIIQRIKDLENFEPYYNQIISNKSDEFVERYREKLKHIEGELIALKETNMPKETKVTDENVLFYQMEYEKYQEIKEKNRIKIEFLANRNHFLKDQNAIAKSKVMAAKKQLDVIEQNIKNKEKRCDEIYKIIEKEKENNKDKENTLSVSSFLRTSSAARAKRKNHSFYEKLDESKQELVKQIYKDLY